MVQFKEGDLNCDERNKKIKINEKEKKWLQKNLTGTCPMSSLWYHQCPKSA